MAMPAARPANSATMLAKSAAPRITMVKKVARKPNSSRTRSDRPLPVTAPTRAADIVLVSASSTVFPTAFSQALMRAPKHGNHVIGGDDADELALRIHHRKHQQVVFVEQLRRLGLVGFGGTGDDFAAHQSRQL